MKGEAENEKEMSNEQNKATLFSSDDRAEACKAELEQRFPYPAADPMMQALFDAVLAWIIERDTSHDTGRDTETH